METLISLLIFLLILGVILTVLQLILGLWPVSPQIKTLAYVIILLVFLIWLLRWLSGGAPLLPL